MSQTCCKRCGFPGPMRWLHAGGDLSRPNSIRLHADRELMCSDPPPKRLMRSVKLPYVLTRRSKPVILTPVIRRGAGIKSP
jgi:hypothetical protein